MSAGGSVSRSGLSWMESLMLKKKKNRWPENKDMNGSEGSSPVWAFQHFYSGQIPPPLAGRHPQTGLWGSRPRAGSRRNSQDPSSTPTAKPGCLRNPARELRAAPGSKEAPPAGRPSRTRGGGSEENERRGMAWPWNPFQFQNLYGTPRAALGAKRIRQR